MKRRVFSTSTAVIFGLVWLLSFGGSISQANIYPPMPDQHFYGDANGDTGITGADVIQHGNYVLSKAYTYDTLQPQTSSQAWNTCDINSDRGCTGTDTILFNSFLLSKTVSIGARPWVLENYNLPLTGNTANTWIPFNIDLHSTFSGNSSGRPGISVVVEIDVSSAGTGELMGRSCTPIGGSRDQLTAAGAQCALAVTMTDWGLNTELGLTESGTYGLQVLGHGDGVLVLKIQILAIPGIDLPGVVLYQDIGFESSETDSISLSCPGSVFETDPINCAVTTATGPSTCAVGPGDTCGGSIDSSCVGPYSAPAPGEAAGPGSCTVEVIKGVASDSHSMPIIESNQDPTISVNCPDNVNETDNAMCSLSVSDPDLPAQTLTCSTSLATTCAVMALNGCSSVNLYAQGEAAGPGSCVVAIAVFDGAGGSGLGSDTIQINEINMSPQWQPYPMGINATIGETFNGPAGHAVDLDMPNTLSGDPGYLTCSLVSYTCSFPITVTGFGASPLDCIANFTAPLSPEDCSLSIQVSDGYTATNSATLPVSVTARIWYVDIDATGAGDGTSWADAFNVVQDGMDAASSGEMVWVAEGNYNLSGSTDPVLTMKDGVYIYGGFHGWESSLNQRGNPKSYPSILDGQGSSWHVVIGANDASLDGFVIQGGNADGDDTNGGGMHNMDLTGYLIIANCSFTNNTAELHGGAIWNHNTSPSVNNCDFSGNSSFGGGAIFNELASPSIYQSNFSNNSSSFHGGAIYNYTSSAPVIYRCQFDHNQSVNWGGAVMNETELNPYISDCWFSNNTGGMAGGIYISGSSPTIIDCGFSHNSAEYGGGAIAAADSSSPLIYHSYFGENLSNWLGGAVIVTSNSNPLIQRCLFKLNEALEGGAIQYINNGNGLTENCIFISNRANDWGGAIHAEFASPTIMNSSFSANWSRTEGAAMNNNQATPIVTNCILWGDIGPGGFEIYDSLSTSTVTYSDVMGGFTGTGNIDADPLYVNPFNLELQQTSPCIDQATSAGAPLVDIEGNSRPSGGGYDMGAYEFQYVTAQWYVDDSATGANNGSSWADAFTSIQDAMVVALSGDNVFVAGGNYVTPGGPTTASVLTMVSGVEIYGGFQGTETYLYQRGNPADNPSIIDGQNTSYHVVLGALGSSLDGFTITGGNANGPADMDKIGGGMFNPSVDSLVVANCIFTANHSAMAGGGMFNYTSSPEVTNCVFNNNSSGQNAGAMMNGDHASPTISQCVFKNNSAQDGGAIRNNNYSEGRIINCIFKGNSAARGGAIKNQRSYPEIVNCTIAFNSASVQGGAIQNVDGSSPMIQNCLIGGNTAPLNPVIDNINSEARVTFSDIENGYPGEGNIDEDPMWVSPPTDLHLLPGSPAIDSGSEYDILDIDIEGNYRPNGGGFDMGAFEYQYPVADWYVDADATGAGTGLSWRDAFHAPRDAMTVASVGEIIFVAEGEYNYSTGMSDPVLTMKDGVDIYGGFVGNELNLYYRGNPMYHPTYLDGANTRYHVVTGASDARLDGFLVTGGLANEGLGGAFDFGGGMHNVDVTGLTVANCYFLSNAAILEGGGIYNENSTVGIFNCQIDGNTANNHGGGITNLNSNVSISNTYFSNNISDSGGGFSTSGSSTTTITNSVFMNNQVDYYGGGLLAEDDSSFELINCTFTLNTAGYSGSAVAAYYGTSTSIGNSILWGDTSPYNEEVYTDNANVDIIYSDVMGGYPGEGNINTDPNFIDVGDPHLDYGSPCIDSGTNDNAPDFDIEHNPRPNGGGYDMGAYEYQWPTADWYVDENATGANTGASWQDAFTNIQDAVDAAASSDVIFVAEGSYFRRSGGTSPVVTMKAGVNIFGGFLGDEATLFERGSPMDNPSILDGENQSYHVVYAAGSTKLDGFSIVNGAAYGSGDDEYGAGLIAKNSSGFQLSNCSFSNNSAYFGGGGIVVLSIYVKLNSCLFDGNSADLGGGLYVEGNSPTIVNSIFVNNFAYKGGGISAEHSSSPTITNCTFSANSAFYGGAINNFDNSSPTITNSILYNDLATNSPEIYNFSLSAPTVNFSDVMGGYTGASNIDADPLFVGGGDYHLDVDSPCNNTGDMSVAPSYDFDHNSRPSNGGVEMGAYEIMGGPGGNQNPVVTVNCPDTVGELVPTTCSLNVTDPDFPPQILSCSLNAATTCVGATITGCSSVDVPAQGLGAAPGSCDVVVNVEDDFTPPGTGQGSDTINIVGNQRPTIISVPPHSVVVGTTYVYNIVATDGEGDPITLSVAVDDNCGGTLTDNFDGTGTYEFTPAGPTPPACTMSVVASDAGGPGMSSTSQVLILPVGYFPAATIGNNQGSLSAAFDGTNFLVAISGDGSSPWNIGAQLIDDTGAKVGGLISTGRTGDLPAVAFDGSNYMMVWTDTTNNPATDFYGVFIDPLGSLVGSPFAISTGLGYGGEGSAIAYGNSVYLTAYSVGDDDSEVALYGRIVSNTGLVGSQFSITTDATFQGGSLNSVAFDGTNFLVVWTPSGTVNPTALKGQLVNTSGILVGSSFYINNDSYWNDNPFSVIFGGGNYLVVWTDEVGGLGSGEWDVFGQLVSPAGSLVGSQIGIATTIDQQFLPMAAFDGANFLVEWTDMTNDANNDWICDPGEGSCWDVYARYVSAAGVPGTTFQLSSLAGNEFGFVTYGGGQYLTLFDIGLISGPEGLVWRDVYGNFLIP